MKYLLLFVMLIAAGVILAQKDYTINISSGKLKISEVNAVTIEGYSGANVTIEIEDYDEFLEELSSYSNDSTTKNITPPYIQSI